MDLRAQQGVGNTGALMLDVDQMSVSGGNGDVNAASPGAVEVDADSLVGKGAGGVTIVAASITVLDNNGGILVMDGGKLVLTATNGNIVFLNQDDTIRLPGGGSITLTARADGTNEGYNGNIITGNLVTEGGYITLDADRNVTLGMLDTGGTGDVYVIARDGVILDGNGADQNVRGDHVTLIGNTPSQRDAEIARDTAIADYAGRMAELNAKILQLQTLQQQLEGVHRRAQLGDRQQEHFPAEPDQRPAHRRTASAASSTAPAAPWITSTAWCPSPRRRWTACPWPPAPLRPFRSVVTAAPTPCSRA